ncbi:MAG: RNA-binding S4 domain-containing protein [Bacteroidales bacterium]|nr:RNA-binding S4 domain-containing protein [Bacteroidales bacterium]
MGESSENIRIDKFLWASRIFRTRSSASEACRKGRVTVNNITAKPSRTVAVNDIIKLRKPPATLVFEVLKPLATRVSAKLVGDFIKDITPEEEKKKLQVSSSVKPGFRPAGAGRPTKKERRDIERFFGTA